MRSPYAHKTFLEILPISLLLIFIPFFVISGCGKKTAPPQSMAPEVFVTQATQEDVPVYEEFVGQTKGFQDVEIRARVEGYLNSVDFKEGSFVKKDDPLYQIDPKPFQAALDEAKATLAQTEAKLAKAKLDVDRFKPLAKAQAISQEELDTAQATYDAAKAAKEAAEAQVEVATLNLGYTKITAPISGLIDITKVKSGNLVGRGENTLLTTISQIDPILVRVNVSETDYLFFAKAKVEQKKNDQATPSFPIELILADGSLHPYHGQVAHVERAINATTGTLTVEISFPNSDLILRPGQYAKVRTVTDTEKGAVLIPQRAVREIQGTYSVAFVDENNQVSFRNVSTGERVGSLWVITEGLREGDKVVVEGLQKIQDGMKINAKMVPPDLETDPATSANPNK